MVLSGWAQQRLGDPAADLREAVMRAIPRAHADAVAAQAVSGTTKRDPYGHTLKNRQYECLVEEAQDIAGVEVFRPHGAAFELVRIPATRAVLFPWRYATDASVPRREARMRTSGFRRELLSVVPEPRGQLTLDEHGLLDADELDVRLAEEDAVREQLRSLARVVTIGYASNVQGLLELGWGDAELTDETGTIDWRKWEPLPVRPGLQAATQDQDRKLPAAAVMRSLSRQASAAPAIRFDNAPLDENDLGLSMRNPRDGETQQEANAQIEDTGTGGEADQR